MEHQDHQFETLPERSRIQRCFDYMEPRILLCQMIVVFAMMAGFWARDFWGADLFNHFYPQYLVLSILSFIFAIVARFKALAFVSIASAAVAYTIMVHSLWLYPKSLPIKADIPAYAKTVKIMHSNVYKGNNEFSNLDTLIKTHNPDVINFHEASHALKGWLGDKYVSTYPYRIYDPAANAFGTIILSRTPIQRHERKVFKGPAYGNGIHVFETAGVKFVSLHALPPMNNESWRQRNLELYYVADIIRRHKGMIGRTSNKRTPIILIGDLNVTPFSPFFRDIARSTQQQFLGQGVYNFKPTWPEGLKFPLFQIQIDHMMYSPENVAVKNWDVMSIKGSDHKAMIAEFAFITP